MAVVDLRYARALDQVVQEKNVPRDQVKQQLGDFIGTYSESTDLREVLQNPAIPEEQKLRLLDAIGTRLEMSGTVRNFLAVVVRHERLHELQDIVDSYLQLADRDTGIAEAEIVSARPLDAEGRRTVEGSIAALTGSSQVRATYREDPTLLGGAVIRVGSTVYDGSVRGQLEQMKHQMIAATA